MNAVAIVGSMLMFSRMKRQCVYLITNTLNGKLYVGRTDQLSSRWSSHKYEARREMPIRARRSPLHSAIRKYGPDVFTMDPIEWCDDEASSCEAERFWIKWYDTFGTAHGYNASSGGEGSNGHKMTEARRALNVTMFKGKKRDRAAVEAGAAKLRGRPKSEDHRAKIGARHRGKTISEKQRTQNSYDQRVRLVNRLGISMSEYAERILSGLAYCNGCAVNPWHWVPASESARSARSNYCRACFRAWRKARKPA